MRPVAIEKARARAIASPSIEVIQPAMRATVIESVTPPSDADGAAEQAEHERLAEKLQPDVPHPPADRAADADFAGALGHRHDHDVHDADAADKQRDRGDGDEQERDGADRARCASMAAAGSWTLKSSS